MASLSPIFTRAYWSLAAAVGLYGFALIVLTNPYLQRHVLYAHKLQTTWWHDINKPETFGFAKNQVTPFNLKTPDNETLHAWHVMPIGLYAQYETELLSQTSGLAHDITKTKAFQLLKDDPEARLIVTFHGNSGHIAQGWRTDSYRSYSRLDPSHIHILAIDYRGFGYSSGFPTEAGLITDGIATVNWALNVAKIPASRIIILGQSLGTAVSSAVADHFSTNGIDFAGVVLIAPFTDLPNLLTTYSIGGWVPILSPLRRTPKLQAVFSSYLVDKWPTLQRLQSVFRVSKTAKLYLIHAYNDYEIPYQHSETLFARLLGSINEDESDLSLEEIDRIKKQATVWKGEQLAATQSNTMEVGEDVSNEGISAAAPDDKDGFVRTWKLGEGKILREEIVSDGGHNRIMTYEPAAIAVWKAFGLDSKEILPTELLSH